MVFNAAGAKDKTMRVIKGANHYYAGQPELLAQANALIRDWLGARSLIT